MEKNEIFTFMSESGGSSRVESSVYQKKKKSHYELSGIREGEGKKGLAKILYMRFILI